MAYTFWKLLNKNQISGPHGSKIKKIRILKVVLWTILGLSQMITDPKLVYARMYTTVARVISNNVKYKYAGGKYNTL